MEEFKVKIPKENFAILNFTNEEFPRVAVVNIALKDDFQGKEAFSWHLMISLKFLELIENGMPSKSEDEIVFNYAEELEEILKGTNKEKPNVLFLARLTWNSTKTLVFRVFDPDITDKSLQKIINSNNYPREFDYTLENDETWKFADWYFNYKN